MGADGDSSEVVRDTLPPCADHHPAALRGETTWRLVQVFGPSLRTLPASTPLRCGEARRIGRLGDLFVPDATISKVHGEISCDGAHVTVTDLGSQNGLYVNAARVHSASLRSGDVLRLGSSLFVLEMFAPTAIGGGYDKLAEQAAAGRLPIILQGETGTGKEVLARRIHELSKRSGRFVPVDCTSLPQTLAESELFGHCRGAFSGANASREGLFRYADRGTVFLDEIVDLAPELQGKLLRVLESRAVRALGGEKEVPIDVQIVAASPVDLAVAVERGRFRRDLHARLAGRVIRLPPLRDRRAEILQLFESINASLGAKLRLTIDAAESLVLCPWPQNVRELKMLIQRAAEDVHLDDQGVRTLHTDYLANDTAPVQPPSSPRESLQHASRRKRPDRPTLELVLAETEGNVSAAARVLGRHRSQVHRWKKRYGIG